MKNKFLVLILVVTAVSLHAADIKVPYFSLFSRGYVENGSFLVNSKLDISVLVEGGYKFGGRLDLGLLSEETSLVSDATALSFISASATMRNIFTLPIDISYFIGQQEAFANGDTFVEIFGTDYFSTQYRGFLYFPTGPQYDGIHNVKGTGFRIQTNPYFSEWFYGAVYAYSDAYLGDGQYSFDGRALFNFPKTKLELFAGASYPYLSTLSLHGGLLFFYQASSTGEFFAELGTTHWEYGTTEPDFFILFEPRVRLGLLSILITFFYQPNYYRDLAFEDSGRGGSIDMNLNFEIGQPAFTPISGGVETCVKITKSADSEVPYFGIHPYLRIVSSGVVWNIKSNINLYPFDLSNIAEGLIGVTAEF